jgi:hypothetical protein
MLSKEEYSNKAGEEIGSNTITDAQFDTLMELFERDILCYEYNKALVIQGKSTEEIANQF